MTRDGYDDLNKVCGSKRTVLMTRACITRFGPRFHVPISFTPPTAPTAPKIEWENALAKTKWLGAHSECNIKKSWHTYSVFASPNRWEPIVVTIDFAFLHTLQYFWEVIFPFCNTLYHFWKVIFKIAGSP